MRCLKEKESGLEFVKVGEQEDNFRFLGESWRKMKKILRICKDKVVLCR